MIGLMLAMLMVFFTCDELRLVVCGDGPVLSNGCGHRDQIVYRSIVPGK